MKDKILILLMICLYGSVTSVQSSQAQFNPTYSNDGKYYMRDINGDTVYGYKNKDWFMFNGANLYLMQAPQGYMKVNSLHEVTLIDSIPYLAISGRPALFSGAYADLTGKPSLFSGSYIDLTNKPTIPPATVLTTTGSGSATYNTSTGALNIPTPVIPAQLNPIQGTGISITGSYPNLTFASTVSAAVPVYNKSALLSNAAVFIVDTFSVSTASPTVSFASILSTTGKSNFKIISCTGYRAVATATTSPQVSVTALTSNSATFSITQQNTATITILGINVLSGLPLILVPDPVNVKLILSLIAY